jgi:hypothetical protein
VTEIQHSNKNGIIEKKKEHRGKQLQMYKWYEGKRRYFKERRHDEKMEIFLQGTKYFLCMQETENVVRVLNYMPNNLGGQMRRTGKENNSWKGWYSDECKKGKEKVMKALSKRNKVKTWEKRHGIVDTKKNIQGNNGERKKSIATCNVKKQGTGGTDG